MQIDADDRLLFQELCVSDYHSLNTIGALFPGTNRRTLSNRLRLLVKDGYLRSRSFYAPRGKGSEQVYCLGSKAFDEIEVDRETREHIQGRVRRSAKRNPLTLRHDLLRTTLRVSLLLRAPREGFTITRWLQGRRFVLIAEIASEDHPFYPDAIFTLEKDGHEFAFCLEVDTASYAVTRSDPASGSSIGQKLEAYTSILRDPYRAEGVLPKTFRVIFLKPTVESNNAILTQPMRFNTIREVLEESKLRPVRKVIRFVTNDRLFSPDSNILENADREMVTFFD
jgi:hypothetical protein